MNIPLEQLKAAFPHKFALYQTLLHNAQIALIHGQTGAISPPDRPDVIRFGAFIRPHLRGNVLDVGIGPIPVPGYYKDAEDFQLIGIDVIDQIETSHTLDACAEFLPFPDEFFDVVLFGGSLNHLCDIARGLKETHRVLKPEGTVLVLMSDINKSYKAGIVEVSGIYYCIPPGAVSPTCMEHHSAETIIDKFTYAGFELKETNQDDKSQIHMRFGK